jgi:hypothetical protein
MRRIIALVGITLAGALLALASYSVQSDRLARQTPPAPAGAELQEASVQPVVVVRHEKPHDRPAPIVVTAPAPAPAPVVVPVVAGATPATALASAPVLPAGDDDRLAEHEDGDDEHAATQRQERHDDEAEHEREHHDE